MISLSYHRWYIVELRLISCFRYLFAELFLELLECTSSTQKLDLISPTPTCPTTYDFLYHSIMDKISLQATNRVHTARRCLAWLAFTKRPLSVVEMQDALTVIVDESADSSLTDNPPDISAVLSCCSGLARLDSINGTSCIRLRDRTIEGYLRRHLSGAEDDLGRACITYLINRSPGGACRTNEELVERLRSNPFYEYASSHWGHHVQVINEQAMTNSTIRTFLSDRTNWEGALQADYAIAQMRRQGFEQPCKYGRPYYPVRSETIHLATRAGATGVVTALLAQDTSSSFLNSRDYYGHTALSYAAQADNEILEVLLSHPLLEIDKRDYEGRTPISHAADNGHALAVGRLLDLNANPNLRDCDGGFPLWYAVQYGHADVVRQLLDHGDLSEVNSSLTEFVGNRIIATPLVCALMNGFTDIAEMLAEMDGIDAHAQAECDDATVLGFAIKTRHEDIALRLLAKYGVGPYSDHKDPVGELLVHSASIGSTRLVKSLLLEHKVNSIMPYPNDPEYEFGSSTALVAAAEKGHDAVVRLLLEHDSSRPDESSGGATALFKAASNGHTNTVKILLADGRIDVNKQTDWGNTPLSVAAFNGHEAVVQALLMNEETDPNIEDCRGRSAIFQAMDDKFTSWDSLRQKCSGVVTSLLADPRVDSNARDGNGNTPLYYAARMGASSLVEFILRDPEVNMGVEDGEAPLGEAACWGHVGVVEAFLKTGRFKINTPLAYSENSPRATLLSIASEYGKMDVVDLLLAQPGIDVCDADGWGRTPLAMAASGGNLAILERLLAVEGVDPNLQDRNGWTPLHRAASGGRSAMIERLLAVKGVDPNLQDGSGWTPLHMAAQSDNPAATVTSLLRAENIEPDLADDQGRTPLSVLCGNEFVSLETIDILTAIDGVNPDSKDDAGRSPLSWAITYSGHQWLDRDISERIEVIRRLLLIPEVNPNAEDAEGLTPLLRAIQGSNSNEFVRVLLEREDLDVQKITVDGLTPMEVAGKMGEMTVRSLLRERGARDEGRDVHTTVPEMDYSSADEELNVEHWKLPSEEPEPLDSHAELEHRRLSNSSMNSLCSLVREKVWDKLARDIFLPLGKQEEILVVEDADDAYLCKRCDAMDLRQVFSVRETDRRGRVIAHLGRIDETWKARECPMCRLITAMASRWSDACNSGMEQTMVGELALIALSSTGTWLCRNRDEEWQHFTSRWTDTMLLSVVPISSRKGENFQDSEDFESFVFRTGFIGRLGSNCEYGATAITIARVDDKVDFAVAKSWIECCRKKHSQRCNPQELAPIPHFRLIDCKTREIVQQGRKVPSYAALSYVWGSSPVIASKEKTEPKACGSDMKKDHLQLGQSVEAVVEDAITVALELGYRFLWVDRHCIIQKKDRKVKQEQLQSMDLVYANADVTLVATAGQASSSGLPGVSTRNPRVPQHCVRIKGHALTLIPPDPAFQIRNSTWMTRGWTYQEGLLSRRRIFFSETEMSFECRDLVAREALRIPPRIQTLMGHLKGRLMMPSWIYGKSGIISSHKKGFDLFDRLAEYTGRRLSYQSDALNGMLGILQVYASHKPRPVYSVCGVPIIHDPENEFGISTVSGDEHADGARVALAGFVSGLCWSLESPGVRRSEFPSWSWAGWDGVVQSDWISHRVSFAQGFDVELWFVRADGVSLMPWEEYYTRMIKAVMEHSQSGFTFYQHHKLDITANTVKVQFHEEHSYHTEPLEWKGTICIGNQIWSGSFDLDQRDSTCTSGTHVTEATSSLRKRLLEESWLGIMLGESREGGDTVGTKVLVLQEVELEVQGVAQWTRIGLLSLSVLESTIESGMLKRRTLRLV